MYECASVILTILVLVQNSPVFAVEQATLEGTPPIGNPEIEKPSRAPCGCPPVDIQQKPAKPPVYVVDWGRIVELTRTDPVVFPLAEANANRYDQAVWIGSAGFAIGGGFALFGALGRLSSGEWTKMNAWSMAGGMSGAAISLLVAWAMSPKQDDLYTVINHWNLRHADRPMAP